MQREAEHAQDAVGAVDQRKAFFGPQLNGRQSGSLERPGGRLGVAAGPDFALADDSECAVAERGEVTAGAQGPVLTNDRSDTCIEHRELEIDNLRTGAREGHRQAAGPQEQHCTHDFELDRVAHPCGVRPDEGDLQLRGALRRDDRARQRPETSRDAVDGRAAVDKPVDERRRTAHCRIGLRRQPRPCAGTGDTDDIGQANPVASQEDFSG